ncbi:MAG TPA: extracellular solute-binding protein [Oceanobacillus sp.]|nr:extracellular solute-binding protein [Oceanobacillus sp.]
MAKIARPQLSRRDFLKGAGALAAASTAALPTYHVFSEPSMQLSGELRILQWSHFVPNHDVWFDAFARNWGEANGVTVTVDHINNADIPAAAAAEISAGEGHDLIEYIFPPSALEPSVLDLTDIHQEAISRFGEQISLCTRASYNPVTNKYFGFAHGWVPDPGDYRRSLWEQIGMPDGPTTWEELLEGGSRIRDELGIQMGIGMSQEIDSNMAARGIIWSFGGAEQTEDGEVAINSPETVAAVAYMKELYERAMTPEVFSWTAASNNQLLVAGQASYILNSISAYRTAQKVDYEVADDIYFTPALKGPGGVGLVSEHLIPTYIIPNHAANPDAAKEFILHLVANYNQAVFNSELYTFPAFASTAPQLFAEGGWLDVDPFGSRPVNKLQLLRDAESWSTVIGHPGPANAAIGEVFGTFIIPNMFAKAARGEMTPEEAVAEAEQLMIPIFDRWRAEGLM